MVLKITDEEVVLMENTPLILDAKGKNYIAVEKPENDNTEYVVRYNGNGVVKNEPVINGKVALPIEYCKEGFVEVTLYKATNESLVPLFVHPLKIWHVGNKEALMYYLGSGYAIPELRNEHARIIALVNALSRSNGRVQSELKEERAKVKALEEEVESLKTELADFKALFDKNVEVMNEALEKIAELEERYDTLAV